MSVFASGLNLFFELEVSEFRTVESYRAKTQSELIIQLAKVEAFVQERLSIAATAPCVVQASADALFRRMPQLPSGRHDYQRRWPVLPLLPVNTIAIPAYAEDASEDGSVETCPDCGRGSVVKRRRRDELPFTSECFCCGHFEGPELGWSDGKQSIPRLDGDRTAC